MEGNKSTNFYKVRDRLRLNDWIYMQLSPGYSCFVWYDLKNSHTWEDLEDWAWKNYDTSCDDLMADRDPTQDELEIFDKLDTGFHVDEKTGKVIFEV